MLNRSGRTSLWEHMRSQVASIQGIEFPSVLDEAANTLAPRYQYLNLSGLDYKGQLTSAYGDRGTSGSVGIGFDFGDLLFPGLTLSVGATVSGEYSKRTLLVLQRMPHEVYATRISQQAIAPPQNSDVTNTTAKLTPVWRTGQPVTLTALEGRLIKGGAGLTGTASLGLPTAVDELGIELSVSGTISLDGGVTIIRLNNIMSNHYPSPSAGFSLQVSLNAALDVLFANQKKADLKKEMDTWIKQKVKEWSDKRQTSLKEDAKNAVAKIQAVVVGLKTKDLENRLAELKATIQSSGRVLEQQSADLSRIDAYIALLRQVQQPEGYKSTLSYLHLYSLFGGFGAGVEATAAVGVPEQLQIPFDVHVPELQAGASASASVGGQAQLIGYRFQTLGDTYYPLILTQDTYVTYRQVSANAEALVKAGIKRSVEAEKTYRTMTYQSVVTYWLYPSPYAAYDAKRITPCSGSGIVYGCSTKLGRLIETAATPDAAENQKYLANLAKQMRLHPDIIKRFLEEAAVLHLIDPEQEGLEGTWPQVILEASFAFDNNVTLQATPKKNGDTVHYQLNDPFREPSVKTFIEEMPQKQFLLFNPMQMPSVAHQASASSGVYLHDALESLRLRFRIADVHEKITPLFSLGFSHLGEFSIDLSKVRGAGHEGFVDLHTQWFNNAEFNEPHNLILAAERSVPPVALLHQ